MYCKIWRDGIHGCFGYQRIENDGRKLSLLLNYNRWPSKIYIKSRSECLNYQHVTHFLYKMLLWLIPRHLLHGMINP